MRQLTINQPRRSLATAVLILLAALLLSPQKAAAKDSRQDYESGYEGRDFSLNYENGTQFVLFRVTYWNDTGTDEGWCESGGLHIKASKDGGNYYEEIGTIKVSSSGGLTMTGSISNAWDESTSSTKICIPKWVLPRQYLNCNITIKCEGYWCDYDGGNCNWKSTSWSFTSSYTHNVRQISWNGSPYVSSDGTVTVPYKFGGGCNTDGDTHICTRINGGYNGTIGYKSPGNYAAGSYTFNLSNIGMNMRSQFTIEPYHEFTHYNDKDASNGTKYYCTYTGAVTMYPLPKATITSAVFSQANRNVTLSWTADYTQHYGNGKWIVYRNGTKAGVVNQVQNQSSYTFTDQNANNNTANKFPYESSVKYYIYFVGNGWDEGTQRSELKSDEVSVSTTRTVPVNNISDESQDDRIVFTWTSDGYPQGWGNKFNIYIDNVLAYTLTPTDGQTSFRWEHRTTDQHDDRQNKTDNGIPYAEEPLNACQPHSYRIEGVIGDKVLCTPVQLNGRAIGSGTLFYSFDATKGAYPGTVKLSWHVNQQGNTAAKTYIVERRRTEKNDEPWVTLYRTSSADDYLMYTDDTPLPGVFYDYQVTVQDRCENGDTIRKEITDIGFAQTTGTMSGRITFGATGSSVANVDVEAKRTGASSDDNAQYHAMRFTDTNGAVTWTYPSATYAADKFATGDFTMQMWIKIDEQPSSVYSSIQFVKFSDDFGLSVDGLGKLKLNKGLTSYSFNVALKAGEYNHVVLTRSGTTLTAGVVGTDEAGQPILNSAHSTDIAFANLPLAGATQLTVGNFIGYVDEFRLWTKCLTEAEILENYDHLLVGNEKQLETYWTFDEGLSKQFFDYSRDGTVYHQHHGKTGSNAMPSNLTPTQLKLKAKTDTDGNYIIQGVPFQGEGTTYAVIPSLGIHQFNPTQQLRFVGNNSLVHNGTDFTDISSFPVRGTIRYAGTDYPVEGVQFYVDGQICAKDGEPVTTNAYGQYEISVPIGQHYITVAKQGHEFADGGRYPADPEKVGTLVNYNDAVSNLDFEDVTLVTVAGRVTGGKVEEGKPLGFGQSVNNIGQATITLGIDTYRLNVERVVSGTTVSYENNASDLPVSSPTPDVQSVTVRQGGDRDAVQKVIIKTDPQTGEFAALLPPIDYRVESISIESNQAVTFDNLPNIYASDPTDTKTDSLVLDGSVGGDLQSPTKYFDYVGKLIQSYYTDPVLEVTQKGRTDGSFGEHTYAYSDKLTPETQVPLFTVADGVGGDLQSPVSYTFGYPLFKQQNTYIFNVRGYETYVNNDGVFKGDLQSPVSYEVPLQQVPVTFTNQMGTGQEVVIDASLTAEDDQRGDLGETAPDQVTLDDNGEAQYVWTAGLPNITAPYTLSLAATFMHNDRTYTWSGIDNPLQPNATNCLTGIVTGALPSGTNFVTSGPDQVTMILRDPAGTGSQAYWEAGNTVTSTITTEQAFGNEAEIMTHTEIGFELTQFNGVGVGAISGIITNTREVTTVDLGVTTAVTGIDSNTKTVSITTNKRVATSDQPEYVGAQGDVFIGNATNILFGNARSVGLKKVDDEYTLEAMDNYVTGTEFGTTFNYTQNFIENVMIPNFISLRNSYLSKGVDSEGLVYASTVTEDDDNYGADGYYTCTKPADPTKPLYTDSVAYYNQQIENWERTLAYNERMKVKAIDNRRTYLDSNQSFDSGTFIEASTTYTTGVSESYTASFEAHLVFGSGTDFEIFGNDVNVNVQSTTSYGNSQTDEWGHERSVTTGYALVEVGDDDALTVDVYRAPDGMGAIFVTRGGQTTCPYEGEQKTKYYEPGKHTIATATMQIEKPAIAVENAANRAGGVPAGKKASYNLLLTNESETGEDCYFDLFAIDETNTEGAKLTINGEPFGNGRAVLVPAGGTVRMNLELAQNNMGGLTYEDIAVVLASQCQKDPASTWEVIGDTVYISAEFVPTSTDVALRIDNAVVNTSTKGMLPLTVSGYDPNYDGLKYIAVQYQGVGETTWHDARKYVMTEGDVVNPIDEVLPANGIINLNFDMTNSAVFPDRTYKFRALSARTYGSGEVTRTSQEIQVVKDMSRPKPLGLPQPTDGILQAGDELSILFNESILNGELTKDANFRITGVLNGSEVAHQTALSVSSGLPAGAAAAQTALSVSSGLPAGTAAAQTEAAINLAGKDFSFDTWLKASGTGTLLTHGTGTQKLTVGLDADSKLVVKIGDQTYTSNNSVPQNQWTFLTLSVSSGFAAGTSSKLSASVAAEEVTTLFSDQEVVAYEGNGPLRVGCGLPAAIHELLLWDEARDMATALQQRSVTKTPSTQGLIGYWKMNEGEGTVITDYARNRHITMAAETWYIENENKTVTLDGEHYLSIPTAEIPTMPQDDYAIELWVKAGEQTAAAQLLQLGEVGLVLNTDGSLALESATVPVASPTGVITDNTWHHIALNVLRQGNAAVYVDGEVKATVSADRIGSLASDRLLIGARRSTVLGGSPAETYDRPLTATIDELRIWNATMTANQLKKQRKVRLTGTEPGLAAYYPFEVKTLNAQNQVVTNGSAADLSGSGKEAELFYYTSSTPQLLNYSDDAPALREKPSEENVNFTFTASDNKIVITLDEAPARVEGTTLSVTVRDVHDQNGNLSEPVTWTAFVSQNPLAWKESSVCCCTTATNETEVTATLVNKSGTTQSWTLSGLPAWLTADVDYGQLLPLGEQAVTFTVSQSTPIGKYERTVYVKGNDGIGTPLTLCVTVTGDTPDWAVNSSSYELSMNLIGRVSILGTPSDDADDIVAAFVGDECRGVAQPEYNEYYDAYFVTMDIYGNGDEGSDPITFKVYDASTGITYPVVTTTLPGQTAPSAILFETDNLLGRYQSPVLLDATDEVEQSIALNNGWNWMSLSVECGDMTVPVVFAKAGGKVDMVKSHTGGFAMHNHDSGQWLGSLSEMSSSKMYAVQTNDAFTLSVTGHRIVTSEAPVTVEEGWNWVGYNAQGLMSVTDALAGMAPQEGDIIKAQQGVAYYSSNRWNGSLKTLTPGKGYKISSTVARSFAYPSVTAASRRIEHGRLNIGNEAVRSQSSIFNPQSSIFTPIDYCLYPANMVLIAQVVGEVSKLCGNGPVGEASKLCGNQPLAGIELGIFAADECRAAAVTDDEGMVYITIPGDEPCKLTFRVADGNSQFVIRNSELRYETDAVIGTPKAPFVINLGETTDVQSVATQPQHTEQVYDLQGRKIVNRKFENRKLNKGVYIINGQKKVK